MLALTAFTAAAWAQSRDSLLLAGARWNVRELADGIQWKYYHFKGNEKLFGTEEFINLLVVDQDASNASFQVAISKDKLELTSTMARKANALAAINGASFSVVPPFGIQTYIRVGGKEISANGKSGDYFTIDSLGKVKLEHNTHVSWIKAPTVLGCGPCLISGGRKQELKDHTRDPRTAVATAGNKVILITVDGRSYQNSTGMTLAELANVLRWLGAEEALALDGGNFTTMYIRDEGSDGVVNYPSGNGNFNHKGERAVANAILLL